MAIACRTASTVTQGISGSDVSVKASGCVSGDYALVTVTAGNTTTDTVSASPSGWTQIYASAGAFSVWGKVLNSVDITALTTGTAIHWTMLSSGGAARIGLASFSGVDNINPVHAVGVANVNSSSVNVVTVAGVTSTLAATMTVVAGGAVSSTATLTLGNVNFASFVSPGTAAGQSGSSYIGFAYLLETVSGTSPTESVGISSGFGPGFGGIQISLGTAFPTAPALTSPAGSSFTDLAATGGPFTWTYSNTDGSGQQSYEFRRKTGAGAYQYWNAATPAFQSTIVDNTTGAGSVTFPAGAWTDGNVYQWSVATTSTSALLGPFAADATVTASVAPTVAITSPGASTIVQLVPIQWTTTVQAGVGASQTAYRVAVESGSFGSTPGSGLNLYDSGVVASSTNLQTTTVLPVATPLRAFVQVTSTGGQVSAWTFSSFVVVLDLPASPSLAGTYDPVTGRVVLTVQGRDNLLSNNTASIETDASGWAASINCSVARSTVVALNGSASLALSSTAAGNVAAVTASGASGAALSVGLVYTAVASFQASTVARACHVEMTWSNAAGTTLSTVVGGNITSTTTGWTQASATATAPAGAAFLQVAVAVAATAAAAEVHYVDSVDASIGTSTLYNRGSLAGTGTALVQRSADSGVTWANVRGATAVLLTPSSAQVATVYDYEATPLATFLYRASVSNTVGVVITSPSSTSLSVTVTPIVTWWLKDPADPTVGQAVNVMPNHATKRLELSTSFRLLGRQRPVIVADTMQGADGQVSCLTLSAAAYTALLVLVNRQATLLLQSPFGEQWYVRVVGERGSILEASAATGPYRTTTLIYVEVDVP